MRDLAADAHLAGDRAQVVRLQAGPEQDGQLERVEAPVVEVEAGLLQVLQVEPDRLPHDRGAADERREPVEDVPQRLAARQVARRQPRQVADAKRERPLRTDQRAERVQRLGATKLDGADFDDLGAGVAVKDLEVERYERKVDHWSSGSQESPLADGIVPCAAMSPLPACRPRPWRRARRRSPAPTAWRLPPRPLGSGGTARRRRPRARQPAADAS